MTLMDKVKEGRRKYGNADGMAYYEGRSLLNKLAPEMADVLIAAEELANAVAYLKTADAFGEKDACIQDALNALAAYRKATEAGE